MAWETWLRFLINAHLKRRAFRGASYSCHYCLTLREPERRAYWLRLAFAGPFVNRAHLLLD